MTNRRTILNRNLPVILLGAMILVETVLLYHTVFFWLKQYWVEYAPDRIGMAVPVLFGLIIAFRIRRHPFDAYRTNKRGLILVVFSLVILFAGVRADINVIQAASLILFLFGALIYLGGLDLGRRFFFLFAFLVLMLPTVSFVMESVLGTHLRIAIAHVSNGFLSIVGCSWDIVDGARLRWGDLTVSAQYSRASLSAPLSLLIPTCAAAELLLIKNRYKFALTLVFFPFFALSHGLFMAVMVGAVRYGNFTVADAMWEHQGWMPAVIYIGLLLILSVFVKKQNILLQKKLSTASQEDSP